MSKKNRQPRWWQAWMCILVVALLWILMARAPLSAAGREAAQLGTVFLVYGLLSWWIHANEGAWLSEAHDRLPRHISGRTGCLNAERDVRVEADGLGAPEQCVELERGAR